MNKDVNDYIRGGTKGAWWMVGMSGVMASLSAFTFTGNASGIYEAGLSPLILYLSGAASSFVLAAFLAAWFRQTRAYTLQDVVRQRFGPEVEQVNAFQAIILGPLGAAVQLWALSIFAGALFGLPVVPTVIVIGLVVLIYSTTGGKWAVLATDFFQSLILFPIAILIAVLCLIKVGGVGEFLQHMSDPALAIDYQFINEPGHWPGNRFSPMWMFAVFISAFFMGISFISAGKFFAVKDGREAKKAAWLQFLVGTICTVLWFIPPMTARFLIPDKVMATPIKEPETASYALIALEVLPNGLVGILVVAMFAASMSSLDTGLNGITGTVVRNVMPFLFRLFKLRPMEERNQLLWCRCTTLFLGLLMIACALYLVHQDQVELFDIFLTIGAVVGLPFGLPFTFALFLKKLPRWSYFSIAGFALLPSIWAFIDSRVNGVTWNLEDRILWIMIFAIAGAAVSRPFYRYSSERYRKQVQDFFDNMKRPIDHASEIKGNYDLQQFQIMGTVTLAGAGFMSLLLLLPNPWEGRLAIFAVCAFVAMIGILLKWAARRRCAAERTVNKSNEPS
jgi:solute:Na+ symporter, SSS family